MPTETNVTTAHERWWAYHVQMQAHEEQEDRLALWCAEDDKLADAVLRIRPATTQEAALQVEVCHALGDWLTHRLDRLRETLEGGV